MVSAYGCNENLNRYGDFLKRKTFNGGAWTEGRFNSFITSTLRAGARRWQPKYDTLNAAKTEKKINPKSGRPCKLHLCPVCKALFPQSQMQADHLIPVIPTSGFDSWDGVIKRLYCELDGYEPLCKECHKTRTKKQNEERKAKKSP